MPDEESNHRSSPLRGETSLLPDASLLGVALIWGVNIPIMQIGLGQIDVFVFNALRLSLSAAVLAALAVRERRKGPVPRVGSMLRPVFVYAVLVSMAYQLLFLLGIARTTAGNTALIMASVPMWTALLARLFIGEVLQMLAWCGLLMAFVGTVIVALQNDGATAAGAQLTGNLIVLAAALFWSVGTVYSRPLLRRVSPIQLSAVAAVMALPVHLLAACGRYESNAVHLRSGALWLIILYSGVLSSGLSQPMWSFGVRHAGAAHAAVVQNLIPLIAIVTAWLVRGESVTDEQLLGGTLIVGGLLMMRSARSRSARG